MPVRVKKPHKVDIVVTIKIIIAIINDGSKYLPVGSMKDSKLTLTDSKNARSINFTLSIGFHSSLCIYGGKRFLFEGVL